MPRWSADACLTSYDFFKAELLKTPYFDDNIICHTAASFAAVRTSPRGSLFDFSQWE